MPAAVAIDATDHIWVSDATGNQVMRFTLPVLPAAPPAEVTSLTAGKSNADHRSIEN